MKKIKNIYLIPFVCICIFAISSTSSYFIYYIRGFELKIGFPYVFYCAFQVRGSDFMNHSWFVKGFMVDFIFHLIFSSLLILVYKIIKRYC